MPRNPTSKIMTRETAQAWRAEAAGRVVFTNGVFDLLHPGHVDILTRARGYGDNLVVGVNTDASVRRLKGPDRPIRDQAERAYVLAALESVDVVVLFGEDTPLALVQELRPDVIAKGGDYDKASIVGAPEVTGWGGEVVIVPLTPDQSTTSIIEKLRGGK